MTLIILTMDDICRRADQESRERLNRRQWGPWHLETATLELVCRKSERSLYRIDLERCATSAQVLDWIFQVRDKTWCSPLDIGHLADAFRDIIDPQANLCSFAISKAINATAHLRRRHGTGKPETRA